MKLHGVLRFTRRGRILPTVVAMALLPRLLGQAHAQTISWVGGTGNYTAISALAGSGTV